MEHCVANCISNWVIRPFIAVVLNENRVHQLKCNSNKITCFKTGNNNLQSQYFSKCSLLLDLSVLIHSVVASMTHHFFIGHIFHSEKLLKFYRLLLKFQSYQHHMFQWDIACDLSFHMKMFDIFQIHWWFIAVIYIYLDIFNPRKAKKNVGWQQEKYNHFIQKKNINNTNNGMNNYTLAACV